MEKRIYGFTKCGHASGIDLPDWDRKLLEQSIDRSLKRLNICIPLIGLNLLHLPVI